MKTAVLLVGHGSKEPYNKETIEFFSSKLKDKYDFVASAFMQINEPTIPEMLEKAADAGVGKILVVPVFLSKGIHIDCDIPGILGLKRGERKGKITAGGREITLVYGEPFGKDLRLLEIIKDRIASAEMQ